jgi:hypothetical protein
MACMIAVWGRRTSLSPRLSGSLDGSMSSPTLDHHPLLSRASLDGTDGEWNEQSSLRALGYFCLGCIRGGRWRDNPALRQHCLDSHGERCLKSLTGVFGFSDGDIFAVGDYQTLIYYDGTGWRVPGG